jgi:hypothetical protein
MIGGWCSKETPSSRIVENGTINRYMRLGDVVPQMSHHSGWWCGQIRQSCTITSRQTWCQRCSRCRDENEWFLSGLRNRCHICYRTRNRAKPCRSRGPGWCHIGSRSSNRGSGHIIYHRRHRCIAKGGRVTLGVVEPPGDPEPERGREQHSTGLSVAKSSSL